MGQKDVLLRMANIKKVTKITTIQNIGSRFSGFNYLLCYFDKTHMYRQSPVKTPDINLCETYKRVLCNNTKKSCK